MKGLVSTLPAPVPTADVCAWCGGAIASPEGPHSGELLHNEDGRKCGAAWDAWSKRVRR